MNSLNRPALVVAVLAGVPASLFFDLTDITGYRREQLAEVFDTLPKTFQRYLRPREVNLDPAGRRKITKNESLI